MSGFTGGGSNTIRGTFSVGLSTTSSTIPLPANTSGVVILYENSGTGKVSRLCNYGCVGTTVSILQTGSGAVITGSTNYLSVNAATGGFSVTTDSGTATNNYTYTIIYSPN